MSLTEMASTLRADADRSGGCCICRGLLVTLLAVTLLLADLSSEALAGKSRHRSSSRSRQAAAAAKARKEQLIKNIQQQITVARQVLVAAESQTTMSQAAVDQALSKLSGIRQEIESAHDDIEQATKTLREIEAEIIAEQPADSELAKAQADLKQAKEATHHAIHLAFHLPDDGDKSVDAARLGDLAKLTDAEQKVLDGDTRFQAAQRELREAGQRFDYLRQNLFQADPDWVAARKNLTDANNRSREGNQQAGTAGINALGDKKNLRDSQEIVAEARAVIDQGEARLRQLGVSQGSLAGTKKGKPK